MSIPPCILCPVYRPDADPREPDRPPVCEGDRRRLAHELAEVVELHHGLANPDPEHAAPSSVERDRQGRRREVWADLLAAPIPGQSSQPSVSGTRDRVVPANLTAVDLTLPARQPNPTAQARLNPEDTVGHLSAATVLDQWVRDWRDLLWPDHHLPVPTVPELAAWLSNRVDAACDRHPAVDEFAAELHHLHGALRVALGETKPAPTVMLAVTCKRCDAVSQLKQYPGDEYISCDACGMLYTKDEYREWTGLLGGYERSQRSPEELAALMRGRGTPTGRTG